jgi:Putative auto-transporter adhesin, head GIN domain
MKRIFLLSFLSFSFFMAFSQKVINDPNVEARVLSGEFHGIEVSNGVELYLSSGDEAVAVSGKDAASRDNIHTEIKDGVLRIWYDWKGSKHLFRGGKELRAYVSCKSLYRLYVNNGSGVHIDGTIRTGFIDIKVHNGSNFKGNIEADSMSVSQGNGSDVTISGRADKLNLRAVNGSDFNGYGLTSDVCDIQASGGSDINITVNKELSVEAGSASEISWKGSARIVRSKAHTAGSVSHRS